MDLTSRGDLAKRLRGRAFEIVLGAMIVLLSLAFLGYLIHRNWATLTAHRWRFNYAQLVLTMLFYLCAFFIAIWAWHSIINRLAGAGDLRLNARIYCYSTAAARLPGIAWDIATRVVMYDQVGVSKAVTGVASVLELGLITLAGVVFYLALTPFTRSFASGLGGGPLAIALVLGIVLTNPHLASYIVRKVRKDALAIPLRYRDTVQWLLIYVLVWLSGGLLLYATVRSIHDLPLSYVVHVLADWTLAGMLGAFVTFVPASLGLKEATLTLLMSRYMPEHIAVVAAILLRLLTTGYSMVLMLAFTRMRSVPGDPCS